MGYHDFKVVDYMRFGSPVSYAGPGLRNRRCRNHKGARDFPSDISSYLHTEVGMGSSLGPFQENPFSIPLSYSPLNSTAKRDSVERRVIVDLSFPEGASVNAGIDKDIYLGQPIRLRLPTVDDLVTLVKLKGRGCALAKRDLRQAYRQFPVDPGDWHLLAYSWRGKTYIDRVLPMGLRSSAFICQRITNAISYIMSTEGYCSINYLDDFALAESWERAHAAFDRLGTLLQECGIEESAHKASPPNTTMTFLGVEFDTVALTLSVTAERLEEIQGLVRWWLGQSSADRHQIESLVGKLNFVAACVRPGRVFIARLLAFLRAFPTNGMATLTPEFHRDLQWWEAFLPSYNGVSMMPWEDWSSPDGVAACDACLVGCGAWYQGKFFHSPFPHHISTQSLHINALELLTIMVTIKLWGHEWVGKRVTLQCDNMSSVLALNSGKARDPFLLQCLREILFVCARHEVEVKAVHIPGVDNRLPDLLSRWDLSSSARSQFYQQVREMSVCEVHVPEELFHFTHDW